MKWILIFGLVVGISFALGRYSYEWRVETAPATKKWMKDVQDTFPRESPVRFHQKGD